MEFGLGEVLVIVFLAVLIVGSFLLKRGERRGAGKE
jgi:preprotein translocase subunit SecG